MQSQEKKRTAAELTGALGADRVFVHGDQFERSRTIWNGAAPRLAEIVVRCDSAEDAAKALEIVRAQQCTVSVRGGGHDWTGRAMSGQVVLDMRGANQVSIDASLRRADVGAGVTAIGLADAAWSSGLVAVTGSVGRVGLVGLTLGGGYGPLTGLAGLALDNVDSFELVRADSQVVHASENENPDLYWALCGGGGNFGVVTKVTYVLHEVGHVLAGSVRFPASATERVLRQLAGILDTTPDELTVEVMIGGPVDGPELWLVPTWSGELRGGQGFLAELEALDPDSISDVRPMPIAESLRFRDGLSPDGVGYHMATRSISRIDDEIVDILLRAARRRPTNASKINVAHFHGRATRIPSDATAFGYRVSHHVVQFVASWHVDPQCSGSVHTEWAEESSESLATAALPGGYVNLLRSEDLDRAAEVYGANASRLLRIKRQVDPGSLFSATPLPAVVSHA